MAAPVPNGAGQGPSGRLTPLEALEVGAMSLWQLQQGAGDGQSARSLLVQVYARKSRHGAGPAFPPRALPSGGD